MVSWHGEENNCLKGMTSAEGRHLLELQKAHSTSEFVAVA